MQSSDRLAGRWRNAGIARPTKIRKGISMRKYIVGNWKMNGTSADLPEIAAIAAMAAQLSGGRQRHLPSRHSRRACCERRLPGFPIGGQDCHMQASGAHTGCVSAAMLVDAGASVTTIVGHSERRAAQYEHDADIRAKADAAHAVGLNVIVCVGETLAGARCRAGASSCAWAT